MTLSVVTGTLTPTPPFDFEKSLDFRGFFAPMEGEQSLAARAFAKAVLIAGQIVVFQVATTGSVDKPRIEYTLCADRPIDEATRQAKAGFKEGLRPPLRTHHIAQSSTSCPCAAER